VSPVKKKLLFLNCFLPMATGGLIYVFFKPTAYVSSVFNRIGFISRLSSITSQTDGWFISFLKYWFCDFLWAYALAFCLLLIFENAKQKYVPPILISCLLSVTIEALQGFHIISGTFDWWDLLAEFLAIAIAVIIKRRLSHEKL
jgi:hypothetical protein